VIEIDRDGKYIGLKKREVSGAVLWMLDNPRNPIASSSPMSDDLGSKKDRHECPWRSQGKLFVWKAIDGLKNEKAQNLVCYEDSQSLNSL
jgi:hypothetical protein